MCHGDPIGTVLPPSLATVALSGTAICLSHDLPHRVNPTEGFIATANQENLPPGYKERISFNWIEPFRYARIVEVLSAGKQLTAHDMMQLQNDEYSIPARELVPLLENPDLPDSNDTLVQTAVELLRNWDFVLDKASVGAGIYAAWQRQLWAAFFGNPCA